MTQNKAVPILGLNFADLAAQTFGILLAIQVISAATSIITARLLGPSGRGVVTVIVLCPALLFTLGHMSVFRILTTRVNQGAYSFATYCGTVLFFIAAMTLVGMGLFIGIYARTPDVFFRGAHVSWPLVFAGISLYPFYLIIQIFGSLLQTREKIGQMNLAIFAQTAVAFVAMVFFVFLMKRGVAGAVFSYVVANAFSALLSLYFVFRLASWPWPVSFRLLRELVGDGMKLHIGVICAFLYQKVNQLMLAHYQESSSVGFFTVAVSFTELLLLVPMACQSVFYAKLSQRNPDTEKAQMASHTLMVYRHNLTLLVVFSVLLTLASRGLIKMFYGAAFLPSWEPFLILLPGAFFLYANNILLNFLIGTRHFIVVSVISVSAACLNIVLNAWLIPLHAAKGASLANTLTYLSVGLAFMISFLRFSGIGPALFLRSLLFTESDRLLYKSYAAQIFAKVFRRQGKDLT
jgi:O-antigen/teichoic acid export membrane protein